MVTTGPRRGAQKLTALRILQRGSPNAAGMFVTGGPRFVRAPRPDDETPGRVGGRARRACLGPALRARHAAPGRHLGVRLVQETAMPGEDNDTSAMMMFSGTERASESGRNLEDLTHGGAAPRDGSRRTDERRGRRHDRVQAAASLVRVTIRVTGLAMAGTGQPDGVPNSPRSGGRAELGKRPRHLVTGRNRGNSGGNKARRTLRGPPRPSPACLRDLGGPVNVGRNDLEPAVPPSLGVLRLWRTAGDPRQPLAVATARPPVRPRTSWPA